MHLPPQPPTDPESASGNLPDSSNENPIALARAAWRVRVRELFSLDSLWVGLVGLILAYLGQRILTPNGVPDGSANITTATRLYEFGVVIFLIGWSYGYVNQSLLRRPASGAPRSLLLLQQRATQVRLATAVLAVLVNVLAILILRQDWFSAFGGWLWPLSLLLLALASAGLNPVRLSGRSAVPRIRTWLRLRRHWIEVGIVIACLLLALVMRAWRLGDLQPGMHGDEGEAGSTALQILHGVRISPFGRGWFQHSNVYFWTVALFLRVFGTGLIGLRSFAVFCGLVTTLFVYLLTREMFGRRAAVLAGFFIAFQSADVLFSRQVSSNTATPTLTVVAYYFLVRGLRTRQYLDWVLAGFAAGFGVYYFAGGRLVVPVAAVFLGYLASMHRHFLKDYWSQMVAFGVAVGLIISPYLAYLVAFPLPSNQYPNDRFIWLHHDELAGLYGASDWRTILWDQLTQTLSIFTYRRDTSANGILDYPVARPIEAVLIILGVAWAMWRWRDSRFALLTLWFWASIVAGGVLTTDAPNLPRIIGLLPMLAVLIAAVLDHFAEQMTELAGRLGSSTRWVRGGRLAGGLFAGGILVISGVENWQMYIGGYLNRHPSAVVTGQAIYVQHKGLGYRYYDMGNPLVYWGHGDNRFINSTADGIDVVNPSNFLPLTDNGPTGEKDVIFMNWQPMRDYLDVLRAYYPEGHTEYFPLGDPAYQTDPIVGYVLTHQQIDRHRILRFNFAPSHGPSVSRSATAVNWPIAGSNLGSLPGKATWDGGLVAPTYDTYQFRLRGPLGARLVIDGITIVRARSTGNRFATGTVTLAQGPHLFHLEARDLSARTPFAVEWGSSALPMSLIDRRFLWDNHIGRAWLGTIRLAGSPIGNSIASQQRRVDGFLGFRATNIAFGQVGPLQGEWSSVLHTTQVGHYGFELNSLGTSSLLIDGRQIIDDLALGPDPHDQSGAVDLLPGDHTLVVRYRYDAGVGYLECWWVPPGGRRTFLITPALHPPAGAAQSPKTGTRIPVPPPIHPTIPEPSAVPHGR